MDMRVSNTWEEEENEINSVSVGLPTLPDGVFSCQKSAFLAVLDFGWRVEKFSGGTLKSGVFLTFFEN